MADFVERERAVSALEKALYSYEDETEAKFKDDPELDLAEWLFHRIFVQVMNGHDRQAILDFPAADAIEKLSAYVQMLEELRKDGWYLQKTKMRTYGQATMTRPLPEPLKEET